jgi:hypothetical protein
LIDLIFLLNKCLKQEEDDGDQELFNHNHDNNEDKGETDDELAE